MDNKTLRYRQSLPLEIKEGYTRNRIISFYNELQGNVYVSFSGGKDSTVLLHQVRNIYPHVPAVFIDTGLEYPEIRDFVKTTDNVIWLKPEIPFKKVIEKYGYPVISKLTARKIHELQNPTEKNESTRKLYIDGITKSGEKCNAAKISTKWLKLVNCGINISDKCCDILKKNPAKKYEKESGNSPYIGVMADEGGARELAYLRNGCNYFGKRNKSTPIAFWTEKDIWEYIKKYNLKYSKIYDMGYERTGCMFCMFGVHLEGKNNRFIKMRNTHPKQYDYCVNKLGLGRILDVIGVDYKGDQIEMFNGDGGE